jgi:uncharacterized protein
MMRFIPLLCVMLASVAMCGCRSAPITYYTLTPADRGGTTAESGRPAVKAILVLRSLPAGIDTTQMLIRTDDTQFRVEERGRWVAPLGDELRAALVDGLRHQYGIIVLDGARHGDGGVARVDLTVRKFDVAERASVTLAVDWALSNAGREMGASVSCQAEFTERAGDTVSGVVAAEQGAVVKLARVLGGAIEASSTGATPMC